MADVDTRTYFLRLSSMHCLFSTCEYARLVHKLVQTESSDGVKSSQDSTMSIVLQQAREPGTKGRGATCVKSLNLSIRPYINTNSYYPVASHSSVSPSFHQGGIFILKAQFQASVSPALLALLLFSLFQSNLQIALQMHVCSISSLLLPSLFRQKETPETETDYEYECKPPRAYNASRYNRNKNSCP